MSHVRQQIREAMVAALVGSGPTIYNGRIFPLYDTVLPAISVFSRAEEIGVENETGRLADIQQRTGLFSVQCYAKADDSLDDSLDNLAVTVESVIFADTTVNNLVRCLDLAETEIEVSGEGEKQIGVITLNFSCRYMTNDGEPEVII